MANRKSTMVELVTELEGILKDEAMSFVRPGLLREQLLAVIDEAKAGEYHDYKNKKHVCGKVELAHRLHLLKLSDLRKRVINGEFDEQADEEDKEMLRRDTPKSLWPMLGLDKK